MQSGPLRIGPEAVGMLAFAAVMLGAAVVAAIPLVRDRRVPAGLLLGGVGGMSAAVALFAWFSHPVLGRDLGATRSALDTLGAVWILGPVVIGGIASLQAVFLAIPVARAKRRAWAAGAAVLFAGLVAAGLEASGGALANNAVFSATRAAAIAVGAGVAAVLALGSTEPDGADGAAAASVALVLYSAAIQRMLPGIAAILVQDPLLAVVPVVRETSYPAFLEPLAPEHPFQWAGLVVLTVAALGVTAFASQQRRTAWTALPWLLAGLALAVGDLENADLAALVAAAK